VKQKRCAEQMLRVALVTTQDGADNDCNRNVERVIILLATCLSLQHSGREAKALGRLRTEVACDNAGAS